MRLFNRRAKALQGVERIALDGSLAGLWDKKKRVLLKRYPSIGELTPGQRLTLRLQQAGHRGAFLLPAFRGRIIDYVFASSGYRSMKSPADMKIIQIEITNACPKRCSNCTRFCGHHKEPFFMDFETFKKAIDSLKGFKGIVGIMGGEPTIHPEFEKFVKYFRDNWGYDDFSTASYLPQSSYVNHILANSYNVNYSNQRGLWTSVTPRYYRHFELIQDTFGYQLVNDHTHPSMHSTLMVTRKELGVPDDEWIKMRDNCWIQNLWSASITPKGAFFCEIAAAMDATLGGKGGWAIEPGWWKRKPAEFGEQLDWCEMCSACLPMPKRDANEETDDVSPIWHQKLKEIESPKLKKGLVHEFDPAALRLQRT